MSFPNVTIDASIKAVWPEAALGCLYYAVSVASENSALLEYYANNVEAQLTRQLATTELADMPNIREGRSAYKAFGANPGRYRISSEALYRRLRQGKALYTVNALVDTNNVISLETGFSLGSYDMARIENDIVFRPGIAGESYEGIGKSIIPLENIPLLADRSGPFGCPTSDSTRAMITLESQQVLTVLYSFSGNAALDAALSMAERHLTRFCLVTDMQVFKAG